MISNFSSKAAAISVMLIVVVSGTTTAQDYMSNPQYAQTSSWGFGGWQPPVSEGSWSKPSNTAGWNLGITGTNTEAGVQVNQVTPNSAATRAGIVPGDTIICVAGDQVGRVNGRILEIGEKINAKADANGRVSMLMMDSRSRQLRPMLVQLDRRQAGLSGMLMVSGGSVAPNSMVTVVLENVSRPHYAVRNGEMTFAVPAYNSGGIPFSVHFDPTYIFPGDTYRVRAYITTGGQTTFDTDVPPYVLTQGNPSNVNLTLRPVSYTAEASTPNYGTGTVVAAGYANYDAISQQVNSAYQRYLGRPATSIELAAWHQLPDIQTRLRKINLELMASQEFYDRVGNNNLLWLEKVFADVVGRSPSSAELDQWMKRFAELGYSRMELVKQLDAQSTR